MLCSACIRFLTNSQAEVSKEELETQSSADKKIPRDSLLEAEMAGESFPIEGGSACTVFNSRKRRLPFQACAKDLGKGLTNLQYQSSNSIRKHHP
jgi:hypothetical protein